MSLNEINPLLDARWAELLETHPGASVFHSRPWLESLQRTYGYEPVVYTTSAPAESLRNGLAFCKIQSWITGRRLVSLPFSDHCDPLVQDQSDLDQLLPSLLEQRRESKWRYIELRPTRTYNWSTRGFHGASEFSFHQIDLVPDLPAIFKKFHKDSTQRKIRKAERENLRVESGNSQELLGDFLTLNLQTRRRHQLPPQPASWFQNLVASFGNDLTIYAAYKEKTPLAAILTLRFKDAVVYKYGCSRSELSNLGGMQLVFWKAIQDAKGQGIRCFDLGRSDIDNEGLNTFKDRWGADKSTLVYVRCPEPKTHAAGDSWGLQIAKQIFTHTPDSLLSAIGAVMYKHIG